jgi:uncharacterized protein (TIGR03546 family)
MTLILKQLFSLLQLLNSDTGTNQIAAGVACGLILGFAPWLSLQALLVFICLFLFRIQIGAALTSAFFFAMVAWLFDPVSHQIGSASSKPKRCARPSPRCTTCRWCRSPVSTTAW